MRKAILFLVALLAVLPGAMLADSYSQLWKQVEDARNKDLPKTQISVLGQIVSKAEAEADYGQMLKAGLMINELRANISPDSIGNAIAGTEAKAKAFEQKDPAVAAIYYAVLGSYYSETYGSVKDSLTKAKVFFAKAMQNPELLAAKRATDYEPFVVKGRDSQIFNHDLLSLIGYQCKDYKTMHDYYEKAGNRAATLMTALELLKQQADDSNQNRVRLLRKSKYIARLDSLINRYSDLKACGEVAIERYQMMNKCTDVKVADKYNYINWALSRWGEWPGMNTLRNVQKVLTTPMFNAQISEKTVYPGAKLRIPVTVRNIKKLTLVFTKTTLNGGRSFIPTGSAWLKEQHKYMIPATARTVSKTFVGRPDYERTQDTLTTEGLPVGVYIVDAYADDDKSEKKSSFLFVSSLFVAAQELPGDKTRLVALDAKTGQPVSNATIVVSKSDNNKTTLKCDSKGEAIFSDKKGSMNLARAYTATDNACPFVEKSTWFSYTPDDRSPEIVRLFTDRSIYRPGQTVHAALVAYKQSKNLETKTLAKRNITLILRDANYQTVEEKEVVTDSLGTASCDFTLPASGLTGSYSIINKGHGSTSFRVEEYKRPTFTVELPEVNQRYQNGDTLVISGTAKTYAGVPVQGAKVRYTVRREQALWWRPVFKRGGFSSDGDILDEQTTTTDSTGVFKMELPMTLPDWETANSDGTKNEDLRYGRFYNITADVDVTDVAGETRSANISVPLGSKPTSLSVELPDMQLRDSLKTIRFNYRNMAGKDISATVRYWIDNSNHAYEAEANKVSPIGWNTEALLKSGRHTLKAVCGTDTLTTNFTVFSLNDATPCVETHNWYYVSDSKFHKDGTPVYVQIGSSDSDVHVLYTAIAGSKLIESGSFDISNSVKTRAIKYDESFGDGLLLNYFWLKDGNIYTHSTTIEKPLPDKKLNLKWTTFRDKTTPGAREEWTLNITKPDGTPADASLMATLYDASLDQIEPNSWLFNLGFYRQMPYAGWATNLGGWCRLSYFYNMKRLDVTDIKLSRMDFNPYLWWSNIRIRGTRAIAGGVLELHEEIVIEKPMAAYAASKVRKSSKVLDAVETSSAENAAFDMVGKSTDSNAEKGRQTGEPQLRENLNETAYFAPALRTDSKGNVVLKFTLPESITTWRFMGLAHDGLMNYGNIDAQTVAKKTVMIQPNMPRFVRSGDKATITARIFNTSEKAVSGNSRLQLIDPETNAVVIEKTAQFSVAANGTKSVSFDFEPTDDYQMLVCKMTAAGGSFSDGEQNYLPVLPNKEMVLNTVPFTQTEPGTKTIDLKPLFGKGATHKSLTVEYTNNPAWLVIQALPYAGTPLNEDIISLSTAFYANSLGANIVKKVPQLKSVFEMWKRETDKNTASLESALNKNSELKTIVLNETPWILDAKNDAQQKRTLAEYFNESLLQNRNNTIVQSMGKLQNVDGSWSWWPGMQGSSWLTMTVARQLARLHSLGADNTQAAMMLNKAKKYIGRQAVKEYELAKKLEKKYGEGYICESFALNYLYINALTGTKPAGNEAKAAEYMLAQLKKGNARTDLFTKALMAVVLAKNGDKQLAAQYLQSLDEYTVATKDMGRYYDTRRAGYSWCDYRIPTQVAALEAMQTVDPEKYKNTITEMQRWLLQQKHTQGWNTPIQTADAIYAFLNGNTATLAKQPHTVLKVDGRRIETSDATAAIGYVKATVDAERSNKLTAEKTSTGTSWGAVYAQAMQKTSDIEASKSGLSITRELLSANGKPVSTLKVGDRVKVRITIRADRNYDFVQVKDDRAACMEPAEQLSGYRYGSYRAPKDNATYFYFDRMTKGTHTVEADYYIDRTGVYQTGTCSVQCAYSPEFAARTASMTIEVK